MILSRLAALFCIALIATACTTPGSGTAPVGDDATAAVSGDIDSEAVAAADEDPMVCKRVVPTGTRVAQRTCMRQSEFDKARQDGHEMLEQVQRRGVQNNVTKE